MAIFISNKISRLVSKPQNRVESPLYSLSDEDFKEQLLQERQRIANDVLNDAESGKRDYSRPLLSELDVK
jgi:hypothetical protein